MNFVPTVPSLSELLETLCVELRGHPHSARTASSSRLRWDRGRSRPSAECALADDGRLRRAPPKLTYVNHIRLGVKGGRVHYSLLYSFRGQMPTQGAKSSFAPPERANALQHSQPLPLDSNESI